MKIILYLITFYLIFDIIKENKYEEEKKEIRLQKNESFSKQNNKSLLDIRKEIEEKRKKNENKLNEINQIKILKNIKLNYNERKKMLEQYYKTKASLINNRETIFLNDIFDNEDKKLYNSSFDFLSMSHNENVSIKGMNLHKNKPDELKIGKSEITFNRINKKENTNLNRKESLFNFGNLDEKNSDNSLFLVGNSKNQQNKNTILSTSNSYSYLYNNNEKNDKIKNSNEVLLFGNPNNLSNTIYLNINDEKPKSLFNIEQKNENSNGLLNINSTNSSKGIAFPNNINDNNNEINNKINDGNELNENKKISLNTNQLFPVKKEENDKNTNLFGINENKNSIFGTNDNKNSIFGTNDNNKSLFEKSQDKNTEKKKFYLRIMIIQILIFLIIQK